MDIIGDNLSLEEFEAYVKGFDFSPLNPTKLVIHHTWSPTKEDWNGEKTLSGMENYYEGLGWSAGPHLFIAEDGIWLFSPMNEQGIHAGSGNSSSIGIEVVGDYDKDKWSGQTKLNALGAIKTLKETLGIPDENIKFHRDYSTKTCPGTAITKEWILCELDPQRQKDIEDNEKILEKRMDKAWDELDEANAVKEYLAQLKNVPYKPYIITEE